LGDNLSDISAYNNWVDDTSVEGIRINRCTNLVVAYNRCSNTTNNALDIGISNNFVVCHGNYIFKGGVNNGRAIHTDRGNYLTITENRIDDSKDIGITGSLYVVCSGNVIKFGSDPTGAQGIQVSVSAGINCDGVVVSNNIIDCNSITTSDGMFSGSGQVNIIIDNNDIRNVGAGKSAINNASGS